ncbi:unnamed protein product [Paramecium sonneborni]|uniref:Uncharacterized protein n=1 Tax=Paramecium sonneborni TaxID=65129 RepID=A0A8S1MFZ1_9CILI|nr:unnamed protein product [Paramecium sonneborni]
MLQREIKSMLMNQDCIPSGLHLPEPQLQEVQEPGNNWFSELKDSEKTILDGGDLSTRSVENNIKNWLKKMLRDPIKTQVGQSNFAFQEKNNHNKQETLLFLPKELLTQQLHNIFQ